MANRPKSEIDVLNRLNISDFRQVNKNHVIELFSILDSVDPEVAKHIIDQIPNFTSLLSNLSSDYRESVNSVLDNNKTSMDNQYRIAEKILDSIDALMKEETFSPEQKIELVDKMIEVQKMLHEKDTENKTWLHKTHEFFSNHWKGLLGGAAVLGLAITAKSFSKKG